MKTNQIHILHIKREREKERVCEDINETQANDEKFATCEQIVKLSYRDRHIQMKFISAWDSKMA
jgi:hypothetical protein